MTTVVCVWVQGNVRYPAVYVARLAAMVRRHLSRPHQFVCLTDKPWLQRPPIRTVAIPSPKPLAGWWAKVKLFDPRLPLKGRVLYLDLDTLVVSNLDPIVDFDAPFALVPHAGEWAGRDGKSVVKRFNSSVMVWNAGEQAHVFHTWTPEIARRLWGDQDHVGEQAPEAAIMPSEWFPRLSEVRGSRIPDGAKVILAKKPKPLEASRQWPWVRAVWEVAA